jgi:hypothetical protein
VADKCAQQATVVTATALKEALQGIQFRSGVSTENGSEIEAALDRELAVRTIRAVLTIPSKTPKWDVSGRQSSRRHRKM